MVFSSPRFFVFLFALLVLLGLLSFRNIKKRALTVASCLFYAAWDWRYLGLLLVISVVDFVAAARIDASERPSTRRNWLLFSIISNLGILAWFKYAGFLVGNANSLLGAFGVSLPALNVFLPAGISFYTFKTMSYTIDVYRRHLSPCRSWLDYSMFITFFPELIAGPIVRASVFLPQMDRDPGPSRARLVLGGSIFLQGLTKKLFIADRLSTIADPVFADPALWSTFNVWCGVVAYSLQIYCDFSGYSDMAIGVARMIGYDLPENFRMPYIARSITDFWHRWHITLSSWLRDYLYIPLGGNRDGRWGTYRNLMLTMLLGGLWHGASWNFVAWGGMHGVALAGHKLWAERRNGPHEVPGAAAWLLTQLFVLFAWVPFRAPSFEATTTLWAKMLGLPEARGATWFPEWLLWSGILVLLGHGVGIAVEKAVDRGSIGRVLGAVERSLGFFLDLSPISGPYLSASGLRPAGAFVVTLWLLGIFCLAPTSTSPFIYFQF